MSSSDAESYRPKEVVELFKMFDVPQYYNALKWNLDTNCIGLLQDSSQVSILRDIFQSNSVDDHQYKKTIFQRSTPEELQQTDSQQAKNFIKQPSLPFASVVRQINNGFALREVNTMHPSQLFRFCDVASKFIEFSPPLPIYIPEFVKRKLEVLTAVGFSDFSCKIFLEDVDKVSGKAFLDLNEFLFPFFVTSDLVTSTVQVQNSSESKAKTSASDSTFDPIKKDMYEIVYSKFVSKHPPQKEARGWLRFSEKEMHSFQDAMDRVTTLFKSKIPSNVTKEQLSKEFQTKLRQHWRKGTKNPCELDENDLIVKPTTSKSSKKTSSSTAEASNSSTPTVKVESNGTENSMRPIPKLSAQSYITVVDHLSILCMKWCPQIFHVENRNYSVIICSTRSGRLLIIALELCSNQSPQLKLLGYCVPFDNNEMIPLFSIISCKNDSINVLCSSCSGKIAVFELELNLANDFMESQLVECAKHVQLFDGTGLCVNCMEVQPLSLKSKNNDTMDDEQEVEYILACSIGLTIHIFQFDLKQSSLIIQLSSYHTNAISALCMHKLSTTREKICLFSSSTDGSVYFWSINLSNKQLIKQVEIIGKQYLYPIFGMSLSPNQCYLAVLREIPYAYMSIKAQSIVLAIPIWELIRSQQQEGQELSSFVCQQVSTPSRLFDVAHLLAKMYSLEEMQQIVTLMQQQSDVNVLKMGYFLLSRWKLYSYEQLPVFDKKEQADLLWEHQIRFFLRVVFSQAEQSLVKSFHLLQQLQSTKIGLLPICDWILLYFSSMEHHNETILQQWNNISGILQAIYEEANELHVFLSLQQSIQQSGPNYQLQLPKRFNCPFCKESIAMELHLRGNCSKTHPFAFSLQSFMLLQSMTNIIKCKGCGNRVESTISDLSLDDPNYLYCQACNCKLV